MERLKAQIRSVEFENDSLAARIHLMREARSDFSEKGCPDVLKGGE
jgi:hypothetical protein